jgi:hypothetical protein
MTSRRCIFLVVLGLWLPVDVLAALPPGYSVCGTIAPADIWAEQGNAYVVSKNFGFPGDTLSSATQSPLLLFENGVQIGPAHTLHAAIRSQGRGAYSHWYNSLYFAASDNSNPRTNGRTYTFAGPCRAPAQIALSTIGNSTTAYATFQSNNQKLVQNRYGIFLVHADSEAADARQRWRLLRSVDAGKSFQLLHTGGDSVKPPTVETDEAGNLYVIDAKYNPCARLGPSEMVRELNNAYVVTKAFPLPGDTLTEGTQSTVRLYEDGLELGPAHTLHQTIRTLGGGGYSHWEHNSSLYFSSSDNSDPRVNGREYTVSHYDGACVCGQLDSAQIAGEQGNAYIVGKDFGFPADTFEFPTQSSLILLENGRPLGPAHTLHADIRSLGRGRYSHWYSSLYFASSDNSDPGVNGRRYAYTGSCPSDSSGYYSATFYKFSPDDGYKRPLVRRLPAGSSGGKYAAYYDSLRQQIYYFTFWDAPTPNFYVLALDGQVKHAQALTLPGANARIQYPHLSMDGSTVYAAWTTYPHSGPFRYWDIHFMKSEDGGFTWKKADGSVLNLPVVADNTGPTDMVNLPDEFDASTWLSSFTYQNGFLHFFYAAFAVPEAGDPSFPPRQHYVRFNVATGSRDVDIYPKWGGLNTSVWALDGFFAKRSDSGDPLLYAIARSADNRIVVLESDDNGVSWIEHAMSDPVTPHGIYSIGGYRRITGDGHIVGAVTRQDPSGSNHEVAFFRVLVRSP